MASTMQSTDVVEIPGTTDAGAPTTTVLSDLELNKQFVGDWLRDQMEEALRIHTATVQQEAIEIFGGTADMLLIGPFQFFGPPGVAPFPPHDVVRIGEPAFAAAVQVYAPFPDPAGSAPAFEAPYEIYFRTGSLHSWNLADAALQGTTSGNLTAGVFVYVDFFTFTPTQADLCEMNAWIQLDTALGNPSGVGGFARSVIPIAPPVLFPVDPPPSDTGLRFAAVEVP